MCFPSRRDQGSSPGYTEGNPEYMYDDFVDHLSMLEMMRMDGRFDLFF